MKARHISLFFLLIWLLAGCRHRGPLPEGIILEQNRYLSLRDGAELMLVDAGSFWMGSNQGSHDERPAHPVHLETFLMDRLQVTNEMYQRFVDEAGYLPTGPWRQGFPSGGERLPVRYVTWTDARAYALWAGRQLPTEAQWEKAARGTDGRTWPWGSTYDPARLWADRAYGEGPAPVGSFSAGTSPYGCLDMAGNVWEWVDDWYDRHQYTLGRPAGGMVHDPAGPEDGAAPYPELSHAGAASGNERSTRKVVRGGAWGPGGIDHSRSARRSWGHPDHWFPDTGFRCSIPLPR